MEYARVHHVVVLHAAILAVSAALLCTATSPKACRHLATVVAREGHVQHHDGLEEYDHVFVATHTNYKSRYKWDN